MGKKAVSTPLAPAAIGPYSQGIATPQGFVFTAGQIPIDPATGTIVSGGIQEQATRVLENVKAIVEAAGSSMQQVVKTTVYLSDLNDFGPMNEIYGRYFATTPPARSTVQVSRLPRDVRVEIDAIALVPR
jgi:2-iminobutanoate/2-iminopropanoate deaminase